MAGTIVWTSQYTIPSGWKATFITQCNVTPSTSNPPVLLAGGYTYVAYSKTDNSLNMNIVAYDWSGNNVGSWPSSGDRYIWNITVDGSGNVAFWGQYSGPSGCIYSNAQIVIPWSTLKQW